MQLCIAELGLECVCRLFVLWGGASSALLQKTTLPFANDSFLTNFHAFPRDDKSLAAGIISLTPSEYWTKNASDGKQKHCQAAEHVEGMRGAEGIIVLSPNGICPSFQRTMDIYAVA